MKEIVVVEFTVSFSLTYIHFKTCKRLLWFNTMVDWLSEARIFTTLIIIIEEEQKSWKEDTLPSITTIDPRRAVVYKHNTHKT